MGLTAIDIDRNIARDPIRDLPFDRNDGFFPIATRCSGCYQASGVAAQEIVSRSKHSLPYGANGLIFVYAGFKTAVVEQSVTDLSLFHVGIENRWDQQVSWLSADQGVNVIKRVTSNGKLDLTAPADGLLFSDVVPIVAAPGESIGHRIFVPAGSTGYRNRVGNQAGLGEYGTKGTGLTDLSHTGTYPTSGGDTRLLTPVAILGRDPDGVRRASLCILGDSIDNNAISIPGGTATNDTGDANGSSGWVERSLNNTIPFSNWSTPGDALTYLTTTNGGGTGRSRRIAAIAQLGYSHILIKFGANDTGLTALQLISRWQILCSEARALGLKVIAVTPPPQASSTDFFALPANQAGGATRLRDFSIWLRANWKAEGAAFLVDLNLLFSNPTDPTQWNLGLNAILGAPPTYDGTHLSQAAVDWLVTQRLLTPAMLTL